MDLVTKKNQNFGRNFTSWIFTCKIKMIQIADEMVDDKFRFDMEFSTSTTIKSHKIQNNFRLRRLQNLCCKPARSSACLERRAGGSYNFIREENDFIMALECRTRYTVHNKNVMIVPVSCEVTTSVK
jgi:hypothetical protein